MAMDSKIAHLVYFTLNDNSPAQVSRLLSEMKKYLDNQDGLESFAVGTLNQDLNRPVNEQGFEVSLHTVFRDRAAHDAYQVCQSHLDFIANNKDNWKQVRVFDSNLE